MAFQAAPTQVNGDIIGAPTWNRLTNNLNWTGRDHPKVKATTAAALTGFTDGSGWQRIRWTSHIFNVGSMHSTLQDPDKFYPPTTGFYHFAFNISLQTGSGGGFSFMSIWVNDAVELSRSQITEYSAREMGCYGDGIFRLVAGDYLSVRVFTLVSDTFPVTATLSRNWALMAWMSN